MATSRIFVKGLPPTITESEFRKHFSANNREITDVKLIQERRIGYVGYKTSDDASKAVKYFNKSYVRMSKISVEPAKAISDPSLPRSRIAGRAAEVATEEKRKPPSGENDVHTTLKKRKREDVDEMDPKLQEYLRTMGRNKEAILGDTIDVQMQDTQPKTPTDAVPGGESDGEYEEIPLRNEKPRKTEPSPKDTVLPKPTQPSVAAEQNNVEMNNGLPGETEPDPVELQNAPGSAPPTADDDDWLRSRTNRLLDLVDPDEIQQQTGAVDTKKTNPPMQDKEDPPRSQSGGNIAADAASEEPEAEVKEQDDALAAIRRTSRLFIRNLPYTATEDDIRAETERFGDVQEVHLPATKAGTSKGFALVLFSDPSGAVEAYQAMDGATFQGRIIHIIPADAKREEGLTESEISKLPLKKQTQIRKKAEAASTTFNWNALFMSQDAVNTSVAQRLGVTKSELLDPTSSDAAVKQAIAETSVIQDTKAYFIANGVDLEAFKSHKRGDTSILVKNFAYGTTLAELRGLFEESGTVLRVLMPPSGTIAIVQFAQANHAKTAFGKLAYRRIKDSVLFLEKAPKDIFKDDDGSAAAAAAEQLKDRPTGISKLNVNDLLSGGDKTEQEVETTSLFVRNLSFDTTTSKMAETFESLSGFISARVKTKQDPKKPGRLLSMGFGFVEFKTKSDAKEALKVMDGFTLDGHNLVVKASHRGLDAAEERRRDDKAKKLAGQRTKIIIKNLPFQATKKDVRALFGTYGQLRSVRVPKKADFSTRGFAFADFVTPREAENALNALRDTHLLGRKLVLDFAEAEALDAEEEIEKMQRKVGGQVNKMALQQLTGGGRKKVNIGNDEEDPEG